MTHQENEKTIITTPESVVRERLDYVVKEIFQFSFPEISSDTILWRNNNILHKIELIPSTKLKIGRDPSSDITLKDHFCSRVHATISSKDGIWMIMDQDSRNGTYINNHPIDGSYLHSGDIIRIGETQFVFMEATITDSTTEPDLYCAVN